MQHLSFLLTAIFALALSALASPVPGNETFVSLAKRTTHTGRGTWFEVGLGNCGYTDSDSDKIVAIGINRYGDGGNCNQWVYITNTANGNTAYGKTRDSCESCDDNSLDMSPSLFEELSTLSTGEITISWHFMEMGWSPS